MLSSLKYSAAAFAMLLSVYLVYAFALVPFIEPSPTRKQSKRPPGQISSRARKLDHLFPPDSWELKRPLVIETEQGTLLFQEYSPEPDGRMKLSPCTLICYLEKSSGQSSAAEGGSVERRPVLLQAPEGATLMFDRPFNLLRGEFGRLVGGRLDGPISITSPASQEGMDDALAINARNVQLDAQRIWTPHEVRFEYGPNAGSGRDLTIYLAGSKKKNPSEPSLGMGGVKLLELIHLDKLQLRMNGSGLFGKAKSQPSSQPTTAVADAEDESFVDVTCQGPLRFDFILQSISLEDHVDLVRHNANGSSDQLLCQFLEILFRRDAKKSAVANAPSTTESKSLKLSPSRVIAKGYPVIIRAASVGIGTRAEHVEYDCIRRQIWLKDTDRIMLRNSQHTIQAKELSYGLAENGQLGNLAAIGPGILHGTVGEPSRRLEVAWQGQVALRRAEEQPVLSFDSNVRIALEETGAFRADSLHLYLNERLARPDQTRVNIEPDRLHALGNVLIETPNLVTRTTEARLWLRYSNGASGIQKLGQANPPSDEQSTAAIFDKAITPSSENNDSDRPQKLEVQASIIEALVKIGEKAAIDRLLLKEHVELRDITSNEPGALTILADLLELQDGASTRPRAALVGSPAEVNVRGATLRGDRFHVYPAENVLQIVGSGNLNFANGANQADVSQTAKISWKKQMHFDGQVVKFDGDVAANLNRQAADGETRGVALSDVMQAKLDQAIDFLHPSNARQVQLAEFSVDGWGLFDVEAFDSTGQKKLAEQMRIRQLTINHLTGDVHGNGPGWLRGVHRGNHTLSLTPTAERASSEAAGLNFLRVDFTNAVVGNFLQRHLEFNTGVKTLYGPVSSWSDALDKSADRDLPPDAVIMTCDRLGLAQVGEQSDLQSVELEAAGNAFVQGNSFSATGGRISYARAKDQLILLGDGRNPATLAFQKEPGKPPSNLSANKLTFWPSTRQFAIEDFRNSDVYDFGQIPGALRQR